jgi:hypothetical protein
MSGLANTVFKGAAKLYQRSVAKRLGAAGLKYEDLIIEDSEMKKGLSRTSAETQLDRWPTLFDLNYCISRVFFFNS